MPKIKTSWTRLINASNTSRIFLALHPERTKLRYANERTLPRMAKTNDVLQDLLGVIDIEHAAVDKDKVLLFSKDAITQDNPEGYRYEPERKIARYAARSKLLSNPEGVEIEVYYATEIPDDHTFSDACGPGDKPGKCGCGKPSDLTEFELDAFDGIIIKTEDVERIRALRENPPVQTEKSEAVVS